MPATSKAQQAVMAIAEHEPEKLYKRNRGVLNMTHDQLHDFAATKTKKLPAKVNASTPRTPGPMATHHSQHWQLPNTTVRGVNQRKG
jgi:hypothetical protein